MPGEKTKPSADEREYVLVGLVGSGIGPSLAPIEHQREADRHALRFVYTLMDSEVQPITEASLPTILEWAPRMGFSALNVTHPFKQAVVPLMAQLSEDAAAIGAVNTVVFREDGPHGHNTDWSGFRRGFERVLPDVPRERVVQLGAGGAGAAVAHALLRLGVVHLTLAEMDPAKAAALADDLGHAYGQARVEIIGLDAVPERLAAADGLVNATPIGMAHHPGSPVDAALLRPDLWVADVVYRPTRTQLLQDAEAVGARTMHGGWMNAYQAVEAFRLFTGLEPHEDAIVEDVLGLIAAGR